MTFSMTPLTYVVVQYKFGPHRTKQSFLRYLINLLKQKLPKIQTKFKLLLYVFVRLYLKNW
jgi:hypothetical protein